MGSICHPRDYNLRLKNLALSLISTCGDGFPHWVFLNSHWSFWCTSHWSFWCTSHWSFIFFCIWKSLFSTSLLNWQFTVVFLHSFWWNWGFTLTWLTFFLWDCFPGLVSILDVCSEASHSLSISLLVKSNNLGNFPNLGGFTNSRASRFLFKDGFYLWFHIL